MPDCAAPDAPSLMLLGTLTDLEQTILSVKGPGEMHVRQIASGSNRVLVEFEGDLTIALDPRVLATGRVHALFGVGTTFAGGTASVYSQGSWSTIASLTPLAARELPLAFLANDVSPTIIQAHSPGREAFSLVSVPQDGAVVVRQSVH